MQDNYKRIMCSFLSGKHVYYIISISLQIWMDFYEVPEELGIYQSRIPTQLINLSTSHVSLSFTTRVMF